MKIFKKSKARTVETKEVYTPPCHDGAVEVIHNLYCGGINDVGDMIGKGVDALVPLDSLSSNIWDKGFRGEIHFCPIRDYGTLPTDVLLTLVDKIKHELSIGKKVGVFCIGGHGRTGYVVSVLMGQLGCDNPIEFLRSNYCKSAVETNGQIEHIAEVLGKPELIEKYQIHSTWEEYSSSYFPWVDQYSAPKNGKTCGDCFYFDRESKGFCWYQDDVVEPTDSVCDEFRLL